MLNTVLDTVEVNLHQIILGSRLKLPICDLQGVLLLAAGLEFTVEHRDNILSRGVSQIRIDASDLDKILVAVNPAARTNDTLQQLEQSLNERIEGMIRSGSFGIKNLEVPLKQSVVNHGARDYTSFHKLCFQNQYASAGKTIDQVVEGVKNGTVVASKVEEAARALVRSLVADIGCCLSVVASRRCMPSIAEHSVNVAVLAMAIGIEMELDMEHLRLLGMASLLEDVGMVEVPEEIRNLPRQLNEVEFLEIKRHPVHTANLLHGISGLPDQVQVITYQTHECPDGSGYPRGRLGPSIHPLARILHVADIYTALTSQRPFRRPLKPYSAMECLIRMAHQGKVDRDAVKYLLFVQSLFPIGSYVRLSDGNIAKVIRANGADYTHPIVALTKDQHAKPLGGVSSGAVIDLANSNLTIAESIASPGQDEQELTPEVLGWANRTVKSLANELVA